MQDSIRISDKEKRNLNFLPSDPGIYRFLDNKKKVIYIGKAKNLKKRVKSYFSKSKNIPKKLLRLSEESFFLEVTVTTSELEALLLEQHLINELKPKYNVQFKDDKGYPWIKISTSNRYPSAVSYFGKKNSKDLYFGPFPSSFAVKNSLKIIQKIFKIRDCKEIFFKNRKRPCLQYEIGRCSAPCVKQISRKEYLKEVRHARHLLQGKANDLLEVLYDDMDKNSLAKNYEKAADYRNKISSLREIQRDQSIAGYDKDRDAISISNIRGETRIGVTSVRGGWIVSHKNFLQRNPKLNEGLLESFLSSYYTTEDTCPEMILVNEDLLDRNSIQRSLSEYHKKKILITNKIRNRDIGLMKISKSNTDLYFKKIKKEKKDLSQIFSLIKTRLDLKKDIDLIESYDISHFSGKNALAGKVAFNKEGKAKDQYRIYNISKKNSANDIGSMKEVIERRFSRKNINFKNPSLILIDGGVPHIKAVRETLDQLRIKGVTLLAISKGARRKPEMDLIHTESSRKLNLRKNSSEFLFFQEVRDETHRFSISRQRRKELKTISKSSLDSIESVGAERKKALLRFFGSFDQIVKASPKDLMKVRGVGQRTAVKIYNNLH